MQAKNRAFWQRLKGMGDRELINCLAQSVAQENKILAYSLAYIAEVRRRRLYLSEGFPNLYDFCVRTLPLSPGSVYRRTQVARHVERHPLLLQLIAKGELTLTVASKIAPLLGDSDQDRFIMSFVGKTSRQVDSYLAREFGCAESPDLVTRAKDKLTPVLGVPKPAAEPAQPEVLRLARARDVDAEAVNLARARDADVEAANLARARDSYAEAADLARARDERPDEGANRPKLMREKRFVFRFSGGESLKAKMERARELLSHQDISGKMECVLEAALDEFLAKHAPELKESRASKKQHDPDASYIPQKLRRSALAKANYSCEDHSALGRRCRSRLQLEIDHIVPRAQGGKTVAENLQVLCKAHNLQKAKDQMGSQFIERKIEQRRSGGTG